MKSSFELFWSVLVSPRVWLKWPVLEFLRICCCLVLAELGSLDFPLFALCSLRFPFDPGGDVGWLNRSSVVHRSCCGDCCRVHRLSEVVLMLSGFSLQWRVLLSCNLLKKSRPWCGFWFEVITCVCCWLGQYQNNASSPSQRDRWFLNWFQVLHVAQEMQGRSFGLKTLVYSCTIVRMFGVICYGQACNLFYLELQEVYCFFCNSEFKYCRKGGKCGFVPCVVWNTWCWPTAECMLLFTCFRVLELRPGSLLVSAWGSDCIQFVVYGLVPASLLHLSVRSFCIDSMHLRLVKFVTTCDVLFGTFFRGITMRISEFLILFGGGDFKVFHVLAGGSELFEEHFQILFEYFS